MINGAHVVLYSQDADADRAFFRDVLGYPYIDAHDGWLIFKAPPAEMAVHPTEGPPSHELYFMCDDLEATTAELAEQGIEPVEPTVDAGWGLVTSLRLPGGGTVGLYQPRHQTAYDL